MFRQAVSLMTLGAFLLSTASCSVHKSVPTSPNTLVQQGEQTRIKAILTKSGERIEFSKGVPAEFIKDRIVATGSKATIQIAEADVEKLLEGNTRALSQRVTRNGVEVSGDITARKGGRITLSAAKIAVHIADVDQIWIEKLDGGKVFLVTLGITAAVLLGVMAIALATKQSCPFVYSFDGSAYTLDGEPYGGATSRGLKRTDWGRLKHLKEAGGEYRFKLTNEGLTRSVILKTNGYYDIHMGSLGDPQPAMLAKLMAEPGYPVRYAMEEYAKWQVEQQTMSVPLRR